MNLASIVLKAKASEVSQTPRPCTALRAVRDYYIIFSFAESTNSAYLDRVAKTADVTPATLTAATEATLAPAIAMITAPTCSPTENTAGHTIAWTKSFMS